MEQNALQLCSDYFDSFEDKEVEYLKVIFWCLDAIFNSIVKAVGQIIPHGWHNYSAQYFHVVIPKSHEDSYIGAVVCPILINLNKWNYMYPTHPLYAFQLY